jgi:hypothetical protein
MWRKRISPAPAFKQPSPFNPITGKHGLIGREGIISRCAMMQVIEEDTHDNYVVCRGFDPETMRFYERVCVAKPYGLRGTKSYKVAEVYAAIKPRGKLGDTSGVARTTVGQPASLEEEIDILLDDDDVVVSYLLLDAHGGSPIRYGILTCDLEQGKSCVIEERVYTAVEGQAWSRSLECNAKTYRAYDPLREFYGTSDPENGGAAGVFWFVDTNGYTAADLDALGMTLPDDAPVPTETTIGSIQRIVCVGFNSQCSDAPQT